MRYMTEAPTRGYAGGLLGAGMSPCVVFWPHDRSLCHVYTIVLTDFFYTLVCLAKMEAHRLPLSHVSFDILPHSWVSFVICVGLFYTLVCRAKNQAHRLPLFQVSFDILPL